MNTNMIIDVSILTCVVVLIYLYIRMYLDAKKIEYEFTSIVNHTFRTPLTRINWISKELEKRDLPQEERLLYLQNLNNATEKLMSIVDLIAGIKNIQDITSYSFEATSLRDILEKSITKYREEINKKNLTFQVPTFKDIPLLTMDLKKITFVIDALIENAISYSPDKGKIYIECISENNKLALYVSDNGFGLNMRDKMRIFSKFYRNKKAVLAYPDGMGLHLYMAKQIVARHHGRLLAKSKGVNKGATFILELPFGK